jgi:hypothetical protein
MKWVKVGIFHVKLIPCYQGMTLPLNMGSARVSHKHLRTADEWSPSWGLNTGIVKKIAYYEMLHRALNLENN